MPLGDTWSGECQSAGALYTPRDTELREMCNVGYARGRCPRFPESAPADAVRFILVGDAKAEGTVVRFILEKDHFPAEYGVIGPDTEGRDLLNRQARVFLESQERS